MRTGGGRGRALGLAGGLAAVALVLLVGGRWLFGSEAHTPPVEPDPAVKAARQRAAPAAAELVVPPKQAAPATGSEVGAGAADVAGTAEETGPARRRTPPPGPVLLYEHAVHDPRFPGRTWSLEPGTYDEGEAFANDAVSAVEVPPGREVLLFDDAGCSGARLLLGPGMHDLAPYRFNDRVSSVRVTAAGAEPEAQGPRDAVELQDTDGDAGRWRLQLRGGESERVFAARYGDYDAGAADAVWVPPGYEVTFFREPEAVGPAWVVGAGWFSLEELGIGGVGAVRVRRLGG